MALPAWYLTTRKRSSKMWWLWRATPMRSKECESGRENLHCAATGIAYLSRSMTLTNTACALAGRFRFVSPLRHPRELRHDSLGSDSRADFEPTLHDPRALELESGDFQFRHQSLPVPIRKPHCRLEVRHCRHAGRVSVSRRDGWILRRDNPGAL